VRRKRRRRKKRPAIRRRRVPKRGARRQEKPQPKLKPPEKKERDLDKDFERFKKKFGEVGEYRNEKRWDLAGPNWPGNLKKPAPLANISKVMKKPVPVTVYVRTELLPEKMMWSIHDENENKVCHGGPYMHWYSWHKFTCKLEKGKMYTLKCKDVFGEGWGEGFLLINGYYYCYDYIFDGGYEQVEFLKV